MVAAKVRRSRQRADKHGQMPRELADLILAPGSTFTLHIISHDLSLLVQARHVSLVTGHHGHGRDLLGYSRWPHRRLRTRRARSRLTGPIVRRVAGPDRSASALIRVASVRPHPRDL